MIRGLGNGAIIAALKAKSHLTVPYAGWNETVLLYLEVLSGHARKGEGWNNDVVTLLEQAANISTSGSWNNRVALLWENVIEGFSPFDIPGMIGFYEPDADDYRTLVSGAFSVLQDRSAAGNDIAQASAGSRPLLGGTKLNGREVIDWDMGDLTGAFPALTAGTAVLVAKHEADGDNTKGLFSVTDNIASTALGWSGWLTSTETKGRVVTVESANQNISVANTALLGSWGVYASRYSLAASGLQVLINGSSLGVNAGIVGETMAQTTDEIILGNIGGGALYQSEGELALAVFYDTRLSDENLALVTAWVQARYGLS